MKSQIFKDYYKTLDIADNAPDTDIKKAYRKMAMEHHPDHNPDKPQSEEKFKEITEAYGVLIDPVKRRQYDLFRSAHYAGRSSESSGFRYSQNDIFESIFRDEATRKMFEELSREFQRSGFRSGGSFFENIFFPGGAVGGLSRFIAMIPGPIGKIGMGLKLVQMIGGSIMAYRKIKNAQDRAAGKEPKPSPGLVDSFKKVMHLSQSSETGNSQDLQFSLPLLPQEAKQGAQKKISYKVGEITEELMVRIPENFSDGGKLRIKEKGHWVNGKRGDLILTITIQK
jgi:DnaJ-class molecular chaperone